MKSIYSSTITQSIIGDANSSATIGWVFLYRGSGGDILTYRYADGTLAASANSANFFQNLDNQWIHIAAVCDYPNKTLKAYRNGVQFGATQNLTGTPVFPSTNRVEYIGSFNPGS
jgi:hypothetical protein